ncbi:MAG: phosphatase PAP2 family protein [Paracoccaceae bacterium]|nr:phosphatase PAP2 family protein [Paracoccaceae bacterium]
MLSRSSSLFFRTAVVYFLLAACFSVTVRGGGTYSLVHSFDHVYAVLGTTRVTVPLILTLAGAIYIFGGRRGREIYAQAALVLCTTGLFFAAFHLVKNSMPLAVSFFADPMLTGADRALHFGNMPWQLTHSLGEIVDHDLASFYYVRAWLATALGFPVLLVLFDRDDTRRRRYMILFGFVWIGLGNVLALAFMSAGPVYYERLLGDPAFPGLADALTTSGVEASLTGRIQNYLWDAYILEQSRAGSGISAFPSVHVGMAALVGLYLAERNPALGLVGGLHVVSTLFLSVYLGWHYAVDGYFSIAAVAIACAFLWRRDARAADRCGGLPGRQPRPYPDRAVAAMRSNVASD